MKNVKKLYPIVNKTQYIILENTQPPPFIKCFKAF